MSFLDNIVHGMQDAASQRAVHYLLSIGKKRIAIFNTTLEHSYALLREKAYFDTLETAGITINPDWVVHLANVNFDVAYSTALSLLSNPELPDAVFCTSDVFASAVIKAAHALKISIPKDVAIMGFDNVDLASMTVPTITTVNQPTYQLGFQSCDSLIDQLEGIHNTSKRIILSTEIVVRSST